MKATKQKAPFRARLDAMVAALRAHPRVEIFEYVIRAPAPASAIRAAEQAVGAALPPAIRDFYRAHNGVFLEWGLRGRSYESKTKPFQYPDYGQPPGCINFLPIDKAMSPSWEQGSHVNKIQTDHQKLLFGAVPDPQPKVRAVCVDSYAMYHHGDLILGPEPVMVVSTDHGADMDSSDFTTFDVYLDVTLALYGMCRYKYGLGIGWSRRSKRLREWTKRPSLDSLLTKLKHEDD